MGLRGVFSLPFVAMVLAVTALPINMIISKMAMSNGTSFFILSVYSNALATLVLFPCAFLFRRLVTCSFISDHQLFDTLLVWLCFSSCHRSNRPPLTFPILCRIFLLAFFGSVDSNPSLSTSVSLCLCVCLILDCICFFWLCLCWNIIEADEWLSEN